MSQLNALLDEYGESHQNPTNKTIHWICVPIIVWTVVALLWSIPFPGDARVGPIPVNWATITLVLAQLYYFRLSLSLGLGLLAYNLAMIFLAIGVETNAPWPLWQVALALFVLAWIGQFIGHKFEGKKPSFFKDLQFLLIGPAWLMSFVYRAVGLKL
ncbi:MAG: Mpo1-like protein [Pseudomonadota bacterium]